MAIGYVWKGSGLFFETCYLDWPVPLIHYQPCAIHVKVPLSLPIMSNQKHHSTITHSQIYEPPFTIIDHHEPLWLDHHELSLTIIYHQKPSFTPTYPRLSTRLFQVLRSTLLEASCSGGGWDDGWSPSRLKNDQVVWRNPGFLEPAEFLWVMGGLMAMGSWSWKCLRLTTF